MKISYFAISILLLCSTINAQETKISFSSGYPVYENKKGEKTIGNIGDVFLSHDSKYFFTFGGQGIKTWDYEKGLAIKTIKLGSSFLYYSFSSKKNYFCYQSQDSICVVNLNNEKNILKIPADLYKGVRAKISDDGRFFGLKKDGNIDIYEIDNPEHLFRQYTIGNEYGTDAAFEISGDKLFVLQKKKTNPLNLSVENNNTISIVLYNISTREIVRKAIVPEKGLALEFDPMNEPIISNDGSKILFTYKYYTDMGDIGRLQSGKLSFVVAVWDINENEIVDIFSSADQSQFCKRYFNPVNSNEILIFHKEFNNNKFKQSLLKYSFKTRNSSVVYSSNSYDLFSAPWEEYFDGLAFSSDGKYVLTSELELLNYPDFTKIKNFNGIELFHYSSVLGSDNKHLLFGSSLEFGKVSLALPLSSGKFTFNQLNDYDFYIATLSQDRSKYLNNECRSNPDYDSNEDKLFLDAETFELYDVNTKTKIHEFKQDVSTLNFKYSTTYAFIASCGYESTFKIKEKKQNGYYSQEPEIKKENQLVIWDAGNYKKIHQFGNKILGDDNSIRDLYFVPGDEKILISYVGRSATPLKLIDIKSKEIERVYNLPGDTEFEISNLVFNPLATKFAARSGNRIEIWDYNSGVIANSFTNNNSESIVGFVNNDTELITYSYYDMATKLRDIATGREKISIYVLKDTTQWFATTPDGRFDGTMDAIKNFFVVNGMEVYPLDNLFEKCYTPNLIARVFGGEVFPPLDIELNFLKAVPLVKIHLPDTDSSSNNPTVTIHVEVTDQGGGIDEICLFHNGKLIQSTQRGFKPAGKPEEKATKSYTLTLLDGLNNIKATAFNNQRTEAIPAEVNLTYNGTKASSAMHILAIGINAYNNPRYSLNYAVNDASTFVETLQKGAHDIFASVTTSILTDTQATREGIFSTIKEIQSKAKAEDVFVFYYAGHGVMSSGSISAMPEFYLVPSDVTKMYEADDILRAKGISATEIAFFSKNIAAQKQLFIIDACQSGGAMQAMASRGAAEEKAIAQLARSTGTYFIAASGTEQFASEVTELGHGVFTYSIIEAIKGACKSQDGKLTVNNLKSCVEDRVPELTKKYKGEAQYPTGYGFGQDFPIVIVK